MHLFAASAERCEVQVTGIHVPGARVLSGPAPVTPERLPPLPEGATAIEVRGFDASRVEAGRFQVGFQLALRGADPVAGALLLEDVLARWSAQPELEGELQRPTTWSLPQEHGVMTSRMNLVLDLGARPHPARDEGAAYYSIEHALRVLAQQPEPLRGIRFTPGGWQAGAHGPERAIELRAMQAATGSATRVQRFLRAVEASAAGLSLGSLQLEAPGDTASEETPLADAWSWSARLTEFQDLRARGPRVRPSSLEGLHLVLGILDAFEREGVELDGFIPTRTYAGLARRELGLGDARLRELSANQGYRLELLRLDAATGRGGSDMAASLGLRFHHPDGTVEATRLYEAFRTALLAQPEVRDVALVSAKVITPQTVEVVGLDASLACGKVLRPQAPAQRSGPMTYLRAIASREGIDLGELALNVRDRRDGMEVELNLVQPARVAQSVYDLLWSVETDEAGYRIHNLRLRPGPNGQGWSLTATTSVE
ncbi:MAG: hypothetical protein O2816_19190 [Planctomycetota bacterium]|nr:hypothetical protein [Planctomycetota bacterium]